MRRRTGRLFFRVFFTVLGIAVLIVLCELAFLFSSIMKMEKGWVDFIARDYVQSLIAGLENEGSLTDDAVYEAISAASDDSISGLLINTFADGSHYMYGNIPESPDAGSEKFFTEVIDTGWHSFSKSNPVYVISAERQDDGTWTLGYAAVPEHSYRLEVDVPGHETVWAEQTMPPECIFYSAFICYFCNDFNLTSPYGSSFIPVTYTETHA